MIQSLNQNSIALPALTIDGGLDNKNGTVKTFNDGDEAAGTITVRLVGYSSNQNLGFGDASKAGSRIHLISDGTQYWAVDAVSDVVHISAFS